MAAGCLAVLCSVRSWPSLPVRTISRRRFPRRERPRPSSRSATGRSSPPRAAPSPTAPCWCATARSPRSARTCRFRPAPTSTTRTGKFVSPGIIDAHSHIANDAINEGSVSVSSMTGMEDVLDPTDINIYRDLAGGTTAANILHGSANADRRQDGGHQAALRQDPGERSDVPGRAARHQVRARRERHAQARPGADQPAAVPDARARASSTSSATRSRARRPTARTGRTTTRRRRPARTCCAPRRDLQLDALVEVLEGKRLVHAHSYRADEILMLIRLADEMGFKITTFQHVLEGYKVAKEIAAHDAGASTFSDWWGYKMEAADAIPHNASLMTHKGVLVSINSDDAEQRAAAEHGGGQGDSLRRRQRGSGVRDGDDQPGEAAARSTTASARSKSARTPTWSSGTTIRCRPRRSSSAPTSTASPTTTARRTCSASPTSRRRRAAARRPRRPRSAPTAAQAPARRAQPAPRREVRRQGQRQRTGLGDHQRAHRHGLGAGDSQGHDRHQGQPDRGRRRQRRHSRRASSRSTPAARP